MDITPIYELRERLRAAAVAGTELISEDFRLRRALDAMKPLEAASPVFAKIGQLVRNLTSDGCTNRSEALLDAISLVDALLCTQAQSVVKDTIEPIDLPNLPVTTADIPASTLKELIEALTSSGSGHYSYVIETHDRQPELFKDYRIRSALVRALGASYAELADKAAEWLKDDGNDIVPLLKRGFDPKGKREMERRVQVIDAIAGADENDFYISMLDNAEKDVRCALIYALRHDTRNADLLIEMSKTEKGNCKKMVYWTLAELECGEAGAFFEKYTAKKPLDAAAYLETTDTDWASKLVAREFMRLIKKSEVPTEFTKADGDSLAGWLRALPTKHGEEICECFMSAAALNSSLDRPLAGEEKVWEIDNIQSVGYLRRALKFSEAVRDILLLALVLPHQKTLETLALELADKYDGYFTAAMTAALQLYDSDKVISWIDSKLFKKSLFGKNPKAEVINQFTDCCSQIFWSGNPNEYILRRTIIRQSDGQPATYSFTIDNAVIKYLVSVMVKSGELMDGILSKWVSPDKSEINELIAAHFVEMAHKVKDNRMYLPALGMLGADCSGLAVSYFRKHNKVSHWELISYLNIMPGINAAKAEDARKIYEMIKSKQLEVRNFFPSRFEDYINELENNTTNN
ncbi:MAG: hypothetical protein HFE63_00255 [Clostridiales bacterium]|nr:hypothetical protein [Clostridiales bacterium]